MLAGIDQGAGRVAKENYELERQKVLSLTSSRVVARSFALCVGWAMPLFLR